MTPAALIRAANARRIAADAAMTDADLSNPAKVREWAKAHADFLRACDRHLEQLLDELERR